MFKQRQDGISFSSSSSSIEILLLILSLLLPPFPPSHYPSHLDPDLLRLMLVMGSTWALMALQSDKVASKGREGHDKSRTSPT